MSTERLACAVTGPGASTRCFSSLSPQAGEAAAAVSFSMHGEVTPRLEPGAGGSETVAPGSYQHPAPPTPHPEWQVVSHHEDMGQLLPEQGRHRGKEGEALVLL